MPKVPVYQRSVRTRGPVTPYARPGPSTEAVGAQVAGGVLTQAAKQMAEVEQQEAQKFNSARVMDAYSAISKWKEKSLYDAKAGAFGTRKGEKALGLTDELTGEFDGYADALEQGLANDAQKQAFAKIRASERETVHKSLSVHERRELDAVAEEKFEGAITASVTNGLRAPDEKSRHEARELGEQALQVRGAAQGWSAEQMQVEREKFLTRFHLGVLDGLKEADPQAAEAYLAQWKHEINAEALNRSTVPETIAGAARDRRAEAHVRAALDGAQDAKGAPGWVDEEKARAVVEALPDGPDKDEARKRLDYQLRVKDGAKKHDIRERYDVAYAIVVEKSLSAVPRAEQEWFRKYAPDAWGALVEKDKQQAAARRREGREWVAFQNQQDQIIQFDFMAYPPEARPGLDVTRLWPKASEKQIARMKAQQTVDAEAVRKNMGQSETVVRREFANAEPKKARKKDAEAYASQWYADYKQRNAGKEPTPEEIRKGVAEKVLSTREVEGLIFDSERPVYLIELEEARKRREEDPVPPEDRALIEEALRSTGRPVTEEAVRSLYQRHLNAQLGGGGE